MGALLALSSHAHAEPVSLGTVTIPSGPPRKLVIVRGVELSGTVEAFYEHGGATLGGIPYLAVPSPVGFMVPRRDDRYDPSRLSPLARAHYAKLPRVTRRVREGWDLDSAIVDYHAAQESLFARCSRAYRNALPLGEVRAGQLARAEIDREIAYPDSAGLHKASFAANGSLTIHFVDDFAQSISFVDAGPPPTPAEQAAWLRDRAEDQIRSLRSYLEMAGPAFILYTASAVIMSGGKDATAAFEELDRMKSAGTSEERARLRPSIVHVPQAALTEMEDAGFFERRD